MEWLLLLAVLFGMFFVWSLIRIKLFSKNHHVRKYDVEHGKFLETRQKKNEKIEDHQEERDDSRKFIELRSSVFESPQIAVAEEIGSDTSSCGVNVDDYFLQLLRDIEAHPAEEIFRSVPKEQQISIKEQVEKRTNNREENRYRRLEDAENKKQKTLNELEAIEFEIAENDEWFNCAKEKKVEFTSTDLNLHRKKAEVLYSRKRTIVNNELPELEILISNVISQLEIEEKQEKSFQRRDVERLLEPIYKEREREKAIRRSAKTRKQREAAEAQRQQEYQEFIERQQTERLRRENEERERLVEELARKERLEAEKRKKRKEEISVYAHTRQIPYLVHFTPITNLPSILREGLRSRNALNGHNFVYTDEYRTDGWLDWISVSVSFPNYKMFYAKRNSPENDIQGWAVILIKKEALWELDCKFILTNAASSGIRMFREEKWSSVQAFEDMFGHAEHRIHIPKFYTTDPQAEVMIRNEVPRHYIFMVTVESKLDAMKLNGLSKIRIEVMPELFRWRNDFEHWRQFRLNVFSSDNNLVAPF